MKHHVLLLGKIKDSFIAEGVHEYSTRLQHYTKLELHYLKGKGKKNSLLTTEQEGELLLAHVPAGATIVVLDVAGKQMSSEGLADQVTFWENTAVKEVCYLIGGPLGLSQKVIASANVRLSFSKMTFTHDMVRLLLIEQLYRAYTIKAGEKYHK